MTDHGSASESDETTIINQFYMARLVRVMLDIAFHSFQYHQIPDWLFYAVVSKAKLTPSAI